MAEREGMLFREGAIRIHYCSQQISAGIFERIIFRPVRHTSRRSVPMRIAPRRDKGRQSIVRSARQQHANEAAVLGEVWTAVNNFKRVQLFGWEKAFASLSKSEHRSCAGLAEEEGQE